MTLPHMEWMDKGYHILVVQAEENYYHALVSHDGVEYSIYDRFNAPSLQCVRDHYRFDPWAFEAVKAPVSITRGSALEGETGISAEMESLIQELDKLPYSAVVDWLQSFYDSRREKSMMDGKE